MNTRTLSAEVSPERAIFRVIAFLMWGFVLPLIVILETRPAMPLWQTLVVLGTIMTTLVIMLALTSRDAFCATAFDYECSPQARSLEHPQPFSRVETVIAVAKLLVVIWIPMVLIYLMDLGMQIK